MVFIRCLENLALFFFHRLVVDTFFVLTIITKHAYLVGIWSNKRHFSHRKKDPCSSIYFLSRASSEGAKIHNACIDIELGARKPAHNGKICCLHSSFKNYCFTRIACFELVCHLMIYLIKNSPLKLVGGQSAA